VQLLAGVRDNGPLRKVDDEADDDVKLAITLLGWWIR